MTSYSVISAVTQKRGLNYLRSLRRNLMSQMPEDVSMVASPLLAGLYPWRVADDLRSLRVVDTFLQELVLILLSVSFIFEDILHSNHRLVSLKFSLIYAMKDKEHHETENLILGRFVKQRLLESNTQYNRYLIRDIFGGERAQIKIQPQSEVRPTVLHEAGFLQQMQGYPGFPLMIWSGNFSKAEMGVITQKLGYDLEQLRLATASKRFQLSTVCLIGLQILKILEILHDKHTVLEFISPQTFRLNPYRIDQLLVGSLFHCKRYRSYKTLQLYKIKKAQKLDFLNHFMSRNKIESFSTSRRDDLQSFFYLLVYLLKGKLPWSHLPIQPSRDNIIMLVKVHKSLLNEYSDVREALLKGLPNEFIAIFQHISSLSYQEKPNYSLLRLKLNKVLTKGQLHEQVIPEWVKYLPKMRDQSPKTCQINLLTAKDRRFLQRFYQPYQERIKIDHFNGIVNHHSQKENNQNGSKSLKKIRRNKSHCQLI